jgi:hypothetical protein
MTDWSASAAFAGNGSLNSTPNLNATAAFVQIAGAGVLFAHIAGPVSAFCTIAGQGGLSALLSRPWSATANFNGDGEFARARADIRFSHQEIEATFAGAGSLNVALGLGAMASITLPGAGSLFAHVPGPWSASCTIAGQGGLSALLSRPWSAAATLAGSGSLSAGQGKSAAATLGGAGGMFVDATYLPVFLGDLTVIANQPLGTFTPYDIYDSIVTFLYILLPVPLTYSPNLIFQRPDGSTFPVDSSQVTLGTLHFMTAKGDAFPYRLLTYQMPSSLFIYPGAWKVFTDFEGVGASFYVSNELLFALITEDGNPIITEDAFNIIT